MSLTKPADSNEVEAAPAVPRPAAIYLTEFIGTFVLMFVITCAVLADQVLAPLAIGAALMVSIYAGGHISGGHYNPAVSLAAAVRGRLGTRELVGYWTSQLLGAVAASGVGVSLINPPARHATTFSGRNLAAAFVAELIVTFVLAYVVLNVATSRDHPNNSFYGLAIGFTVFAGAVAVGGVSGGAFNPAVAIGASVAGLFAWGNIWIYAVACLLGGAMAGVAFKWINPIDI